MSRGCPATPQRSILALARNLSPSTAILCAGIGAAPPYRLLLNAGAIRFVPTRLALEQGGWLSISLTRRESGFQTMRGGDTLDMSRPEWTALMSANGA